MEKVMSPAKKPRRPRGRAMGSKVLARVRRACLALPDTQEKIAWGAPTFRVRGRIFVTYSDNHHGDGRVAIICNAPGGAQEALVASDPEGYFVPPYVGCHGWVGVRLDLGLRWSEIARRIEIAHRVTSEKRR
jgi:hypothetical protein